MKATRDNNGNREVFYMDRGGMRFYFGSLVTFNRELRKIGDLVSVTVGRTKMTDETWRTIPTAKVESHETLMRTPIFTGVAGEATSQNEQSVSTH
jgi:hypothetical protein